MARPLIPAVIKPFAELGFDYNKARESGAEAYGDCIFCGKVNKLYVNMNTGQWSCKAGNCLREGNLYTFITMWHTMWYEDPPEQSAYDVLSTDRGIPIGTLKAVGIVYDDAHSRWALPLRNQSGAIVNFRFYKVGGKFMGLPTLDAYIFGLDKYKDGAAYDTVIMCEGEWDTICMQLVLDAAGIENSIALGTPGAGVFKDEWVNMFSGKNFVVAYDNDVGGRKGASRLCKKLNDVVTSLQIIVWDSTAPIKYDMRDFYCDGKSYDEWLELLAFPAEEEQNNSNSGGVHASHSALPLPLGAKPAFGAVLQSYKRWMFLTEDLENAIRIAYAVCISQHLPGDPLWIHLVSPPGGGKTEILVSLEGSVGCHLESTLTAHSLVSGFRTGDGKDPSLLPKLNGKTFVLKDLTELLEMNKVARDEVYSTLRGAYDGKVRKPFGNGITREYVTNFSVVAGVTPALYADRSANLGERFLIYHIQKGVGFDSTEAVMAALNHAGKESPMRAELRQVARDYLDNSVDISAMPELSTEYKLKISSVAHIVASLRGQSQYDLRNDTLLYRPQHEVPTRIALQLGRLSLALAMLEDPIEVTDSVYKLVTRVAFDTCIGFNLDIINLLAITPYLQVYDIADITEIPVSTLRVKLENMENLGAVIKTVEDNPHGRGAPIYKYDLSDHIRKHWMTAKLHLQGKAPTQEREAIDITKRQKGE